MSNIIEQNGRLLSTEQAAPPTDPRTKGLRAVPQSPAPESQRICRDFVWGICSMDEHCKYRHELEYESMRSILKFCHDFQNRTGCIRPECTYLHASREEENLFLTSGVIPRVLIERYASISVPKETASEPLAPMMYMNDYMTQPPPPPPPSAQSSQPAPAPLPASMPGPAAMGPPMLPHLTGSMHPSMTQMPVCNMMPAPATVARQIEQPSHAQMPITVKTNLHAIMPSMSAPVTTPMPSILPPPPPPPPPPPTLATAPTQMTSPVYTGGQPMQHSVAPIYSLTPSPQLQQPQQPAQPQFSLPVIFDPSRPPPPIAVKRPATAEAEAGPSKVLKLADDDSLCDSCVEQNLRSVIEQQEIEKNQREEEYKRRIFEQNSEEYENGNVLLRSLLPPNIYRVVEEFLDSDSATDMFASSSSPTYGNNSAATIPKQFMFQLVDVLFNKRNAEQHTSPLELLTRRSTSQSELMFASILELLQNGVSSDSRTSLFDTITSNGLSRMRNPLELSPPPPRYPTAAPPRYSATVPYVSTNQSEVVPPVASYRPEPAASYRPEPAASYRPEPAASYRPEPAASYRPEPAASYRPEPAASYRSELAASYRPEPAASYRPEPAASYRPEPAASYRPEPAASYRPEPVPPPQPMYVPYQAAPGPMGAPTAATPPRPYYHPYPSTSSNMSPMPYAPAGGVPGPAPPAPSQPYQYMPRMPPHYYPPFQ